ncbi:VWA domain-containing protein [Budviciaceae bacterium CWB-B4]|uniref:VWA domain-containing protein n=1 Tax=Limnobaculum xujianqingii TaxID=2738837 RepID=A0A9D7AGI8_9GAMM|nr:VWA domain-containing protein [Limnobaculum xujianqingii]MBK5072306.1 VWA domain-containing protein [Limnobaculum xujianqingii]MBK5175615.1 VWA domain-containing protein [Limnobaculum xujianqingii]
MNIKYLFSALALLSGSAFATSITPTPYVITKSELSSPIILEGSQEHNYLKISLTGTKQDTDRRTPINLALVIDRSTSMSGDRIEKAREAAILAINMLKDDDIISIIAYDNDAHVVIPATKANNKQKLIKTINDKITPQGWTALFAGVSKGIKEVNKFHKKDQVNRIILLSDGQANVGPSSTKELADLGIVAAKQGIAVTTIGLGASYNEDLMTALASYSDGNHAFVEKSADLEAAFVREFKDVMSVVAQEVTVTIRLQDGVKPVRLLGREGDIKGNNVTVKMNQLYSNQEKYVLLEVIPPKGKENEKKPLADVVISYDNLQTSKKDNLENRIDIAYSKSEQAVKQAVQEEIVVDSAIQKANLENEKAIKLLDEGKKDEANKIIQQNASTLDALSSSVSSPSARAKASGGAVENKKLSEDLDSKSEAVSRKSMKESTYKTQKQQSKN